MVLTFHRQRGFIALFSVLTLVALVGVVTFVLVVGSGQVRMLRRKGALAQATRAAQEVLTRQLYEDHLRHPRLWIPALEGGRILTDGTRVEWARRPVDARWRVGARVWGEDEVMRWIRLGANPERVRHWTAWLEARSLRREPNLGWRGDLITDCTFLEHLCSDIGLTEQGLQASGIWTTDEGGALARLNLIGADPAVLAKLSGVPAERITAVQRSLAQGVEDPAHGSNLFGFQDSQALGPWASIRPFTEAYWSVRVHLPSLSEPVLMSWRSSLEDGPPGNPWFQVHPVSPDRW